jgi:hypothetical protein
MRHRDRVVVREGARARRQLIEDMRASLATRDVILYGGHSGPFYGFALANWRMTDEGDLDDSELESVEMPVGRYQIVVADGCDTYRMGAAFGRNPAHPDLRDLDVVTTTSFSDALEPSTIQDFATRAARHGTAPPCAPTRPAARLHSRLDSHPAWRTPPPGRRHFASGRALLL